MYEQAQRLPYTSPYGTTSVVTVELARKLAELTPGDLGASFFCNSGSEAVEAAIKLARQYHEANGEGRRYKVVSLRRAYHGSTLGALSATGWSPGFGVFRRSADPIVPAAGFANAMPPYCYRCELGLAYPGVRPRLRHDDRAGDPGQRSGARVLRHPRAGHGDGRLHRPAARATWPGSARSATATASC